MALITLKWYIFITKWYISDLNVSYFFKYSSLIDNNKFLGVPVAFIVIAGDASRVSRFIVAPDAFRQKSRNVCGTKKCIAMHLHTADRAGTSK